MSKKATQTQTGKAFEYSILKEFEEKLKDKTNVEVIVNKAYETAKECFDVFDSQEKGRYLLHSSFAVNFLMDIEPRLSNDISIDDILQLEILTDSRGQEGDVRDVLIIRLLQKWEIGVSAKNNHKAVKHSRLSNNIDFGDKWVGVPCSKNYFSEIAKVFDPLEQIKKDSNSTQKWNTISNKEESIYVPILHAFKKELYRIYKSSPSEVASSLIQYLVGKKDFYKIIKGTDELEIQAYNLYGSLNLAFEEIEPKFKTPKINLPSKIIDIYFKENSKTTLIAEFDNDWKLSLRIHNASSRIEPSLKFDITLLTVPHSLFTNKLSVPKEI